MTEPTFFYEAKGQVLVIHLPKELDHHNCRNLRYETDLLLSENYITRMVFDFSRTVFMDSSGIGILLNRYKQMQRSGGSVAIYGVGVQINRILNLGGIWNLINGFSSKEAAIAGTVKGKKIKSIGSAAKHALTWAVCRVGFIGYLVNLFLPA